MTASNCLTETLLYKITLLLLILCGTAPAASAVFTLSWRAQNDGAKNLTPRQREIYKEKKRLESADEEERRDAVMRLGLMRHPEAARVVISALSDSSPKVRAVAAKAILTLPPSESAEALIPLLKDRDAFVRQEAAYVLGKTHSSVAVPALSDRLLTDKKDGVRGAAAVALGEIGDESAVPALVQVVSGLEGNEGKSQRRKERNEFVLRAAVMALGQIHGRAGVDALVEVLGNEKLPSDVRREAARSLGMIGDTRAVPALKAAVIESDPYLSRLAAESLRKLSGNP